MKTILISMMAALVAVVMTGSLRFDYLDFDNLNFDITWDDIHDDLWP